ncbi:hypothetical protein VNO77_15325 [Canavalia gladiata]|uniref:Uncharacterized protein n=1 Tax=Canavalia gladiata TaxID=3824 RepID=A0AAN9M064_CANGL
MSIEGTHFVHDFFFGLAIMNRKFYYALCNASLPPQSSVFNQSSLLSKAFKDSSLKISMKEFQCTHLHDQCGFGSALRVIHV